MNILCVANGTLSQAHQELPICASLKQAGHEVRVVHDPNSGIFNIGEICTPLVIEDFIVSPHGKYEVGQVALLLEGFVPEVIFGLDQSVSPFVKSLKAYYKTNAFTMFLDFPKHVIDEGSPQDYNPDYSNRYYFWMREALDAGKIIFNNEVACIELFNRMGVESHLVWYPLCNLDHIEKINQLPQEDSDPYVVSCHRFIHYKGTEYLIKAMYGIEADYVAIGVSGNLFLQLRAYGASVLGDRFKCRHKTEEIDKLKLIKNSNLLCYPQITHWIGGLSPLEAMALKRPVVCFDYPVLRELYGECASYAKPKDIDDLQKKILMILNEDYDKGLINRAYDRIYKYFTPIEMAKNLTEVFNGRPCYRN